MTKLSKRIAQDRNVMQSKVITTQDDSDTIIQYLQDKTGNAILSKKLQEKLDRMHVCCDLIRQYYSRGKVVPMLKKQFALSDASAYRLFEETTYIFNVTQSSPKDFYLDMLLGEIKETKRKCLAGTKPDLRSAAACDKNMAMVIKEFGGSNISQLYEKLQVPVLQIGFFPELMNFELPENWQQMVDKLKKSKLRKNLMIDTAEDAEIVGDDATE